MVKTLVLVVDRDDDFGVKGGVETPVIGIDGAISAAIDLGVEDPEDSDVNGLLAGINIYKEMKKEGKEVEIALICGDKKVGHRSDSILIEELDIVLEEVKPDRSILVGDGAEDEYIYPIISSRVRIDSVRKVYVKQTPGIEGFFYIVSKALSDPAKKRRFLAPLGILLTVIAMIYIIADISAFSVTESSSYLFSLTAPMVLLLIGLILIFYAYDTLDYVTEKWNKWMEGIRSNSLSATFTLLAIAVIIIGLIIAFYSISDVYGNGLTYLVLQFLSNFLWPVAFAVFFYQIGSAVSQLVEFKSFEYTIITTILMGFGIAFIVQAVLDFVRNYLGHYAFDNNLILAEVIMGISFTLVSSLITLFYRRLDVEPEGVVADEA